jgi:alpha-L-fucosidase
VGHSFGANRFERPQDIVSATELIQLFCDVVAKNGNLLIGVGPRPDGTIPEAQAAPLLGLGAWMADNGEAIYGSRPWSIAESETTGGTPLRFTLSGSGVYCLVMGPPAERRLELRAIDGARVTRVRLVGTNDLLEWSDEGGALTVTLPERLSLAAVTALDLGQGVRTRIG